MADKVPKDSISNEEDILNRYLADALKEEIANLRARLEARGLPNSRSESSLNTSAGSVLPDYLTGFRIPMVSTSGSSSSGSSNSSLRSAFNNLNFNQHEGSSQTAASTENGSQAQDMETQDAPSPPAATGNPFQENTEETTVNQVISSTSLLDENQETMEINELFKTQISQATVDSIKSSLLSGKPGNITTVASDSNLLATPPSKPRRSGRLLSKKENLGSKVKISGGKLSIKKSSKLGSKLKTPSFSRTRSRGSLSQIPFPNLTPSREKNSRQTGKRSLELSPGVIEPRKQSRTDSLPEKQLNSETSPPREKRPQRRSRTRSADQSGVFSHARGTPTANANVNKQTHVAGHVLTPRGVLMQRADQALEAARAIINSTMQDNSTPWPSAHNLDEFTSNLTPIPQTGRSGTLNLSDVLNDQLDPDVAKKLMNLPVIRSSDLEGESSSDESEDSIKLGDIYPPRTLRGKKATPAASFDNLTKTKKSNNKSQPGHTADPIKTLRDLCDNAKFTGSVAKFPTNLGNMPTNQPCTDNTSLVTTGNLPRITDWDSYLKSFNTNPFSSTNQSAASLTSNSSRQINQANNLVVTVTNNTKHIVSTNSPQEMPLEPIFEDAKSVWQQLRNALCRDVILRLRYKHLETMVSDGLIPNWSVSYKPPTGLLTNHNQVQHVIQVRRQIFIQQCECTMYLTQKEIDAVQARISDLKKSLHALYQTPAGKAFSFEAALNSAILQADKQRRQTFEELNKRITAIRQNPEQALLQGLPEEFLTPDGNSSNQNEGEPQPGTSSDPQPGPSRTNNQPGSRSNAPQAGPSHNARPQQPTWGSNQPPRSNSKPRSNATKPPGSNNGWVKVVKKSKKNKGKGKSSTNAPYQRNNNQGRRQEPDPKEELYDLLSGFFKKHNKNNKKPQ